MTKTHTRQRKPKRTGRRPKPISKRKLMNFSAREVLEIAQRARDLGLALDGMQESITKLGVALDILGEELRKRPKKPQKAP